MRLKQTSKTTELSIIIVNYNVRQLLLDCIKSIVETSEGIDYEIIVVDNASSDGSVAAVTDTFHQVRVIANKDNVGFAGANNQGYAISKGEFILLLNPDTIVKNGAIKNVLDFLENTPDAGMVGCRLLNVDGSLQKSIRIFHTVAEQVLSAFFLDKIFFSYNWKSSHYKNEPHRIDYATGAFLMIRRKAIGEMQLLNSDFFMYAEEKDLAIRLKEHGWYTYFVPFAEIIHLGGASTNQVPVDMFRELYRSNIKFFFLHYGRTKSFVLCLSILFVLLTHCIVSIPFIFTARGLNRFKLYIDALFEFPFMLKAQIVQYGNKTLI